jgi:hypothetical protein
MLNPKTLLNNNPFSIQPPSPAVAGRAPPQRRHLNCHKRQAQLFRKRSLYPSHHNHLLMLNRSSLLKKTRFSRSRQVQLSLVVLLLGVGMSTDINFKLNFFGSAFSPP